MGINDPPSTGPAGDPELPLCSVWHRVDKNQQMSVPPLPLSSGGPWPSPTLFPPRLPPKGPSPLLQTLPSAPAVQLPSTLLRSEVESDHFNSSKGPKHKGTGREVPVLSAALLTAVPSSGRGHPEALFHMLRDTPPPANPVASGRPLQSAGAGGDQTVSVVPVLLLTK